MSLPSFPDTDNTPTREEAINQIISSIAMEELGLSHIINAEGEKLQYALGTIPGVTGPEKPLTMEELLTLNSSIHKTLDSTMMNQFFLRDKLLSALSASILQGPTGPTGPQGPVSISVNAEVERLAPDAEPYVLNIGSEERVELKFGIPAGAAGADGTTPTVEVGTTETIEPGLDAAVTAEDSTTGIVLNFQIPRGAIGTVGVLGIQAILNNEGGTDLQIPTGAPIVFDEVLSQAGQGITYNTNTGIFNITAEGLNSIYMINWWVFVEGFDSEDAAFALNVGGSSYLTPIFHPDMQLSGSTLAVVGDAPVNISLTNASANEITIPNIAIQAQISIMGFKLTS